MLGLDSFLGFINSDSIRTVGEERVHDVVVFLNKGKTIKIILLFVFLFFNLLFMLVFIRIKVEKENILTTLNVLGKS